jgi:uncharacterized SAM-binding protein YcdF (DUF218 family)
MLRTLGYATAIVAALAGGIFFALASYSTINDSPLFKADMIVVLGSRANPDGTVTPVLKSRVDRGIELWKDGMAPKILVTGGAVANAQIEAVAMARYAMEQGVPEDAIVVEPRARNTRDNAKLSAQMLGRKQLGGHIILVTSAYHTRRATGLFKEQEFSVQTVAVPYPPESNLFDKLHYLAHEIGATLLR